MNRNICKTALLNGGSLNPLILPNNPNGTGTCNPSIIKTKDKTYVVIRHVQYALYHSEENQKFHSPYGQLVYLNPEDDITLTTNNYLGEYNLETGELTNVKKVDTSNFDKKPLWEFVGLEDARLINWNDNLLFSGVRRDTTTNGQGRMEISYIKNYKEISRNRIEPVKDTYCEKNWMPILDMPYHYVKWCEPTEIVKVDPLTNIAETIILKDQKTFFTRDQRGGSQVVRYKDYWVAITHEVDLWFSEQNNKDSQYYHRILVWDENWNIVNWSDEFKFMDAQIEFCCGLHIDNSGVFISFGYQDNAAYVLKMPHNVFENIAGLSNEVLKNSNFIDNKSILDNYIMNPKNSVINFNLGLDYYNKNQFAAALSFFLRAAELSQDKKLIYEYLLLVAKCIQSIGKRENCELELLSNAVRFDPTRPEGYLMLSIYFERLRQYSTAQTWAKIGLSMSNLFKQSNNQIYGEHKKIIDYYDSYKLEFQIALCNWSLGQSDLSRKQFKDLFHSDKNISEDYFNLIHKNITDLSPFPYINYDFNKRNQLKHKFKGYEKITKNFSQCLQDIFVLTMLDGKTDGTYLEIGSAEPYIGNNTALLEKLGWSGISIEIDKELCDLFKRKRNNPVINMNAVDYDYTSVRGIVDYLQLDCDPPEITYQILTRLNFDHCKYKVITYEHDYYVDESKTYRDKSRSFLKSKGYMLIAGNVAPNDTDNFEDWWIHPELVDFEIVNKMVQKDDKIKNAFNCLYEIKDTRKILGHIDSDKLLNL